MTIVTRCFLIVFLLFAASACGPKTSEEPASESAEASDRIDLIVAGEHIVTMDADANVIKNGAVVETLSIDSDPFMHEMSVEAPPEGEDRYRHQVVRANVPLTVGSYVWLRAAEAPEPGESSSGCSCRLVNRADHDTGVLLAVLALGAWRRRRRRAC